VVQTGASSRRSTLRCKRAATCVLGVSEKRPERERVADAQAGGGEEAGGAFAALPRLRRGPRGRLTQAVHTPATRQPSARRELRTVQAHGHRSLAAEDALVSRRDDERVEPSDHAPRT